MSKDASRDVKALDLSLWPNGYVFVDIHKGHELSRGKSHTTHFLEVCLKVGIVQATVYCTVIGINYNRRSYSLLVSERENGEELILSATVDFQDGGYAEIRPDFVRGEPYLPLTSFMKVLHFCVWDYLMNEHGNLGYDKVREEAYRYGLLNDVVCKKMAKITGYGIDDVLNEARSLLAH